MVHLTVDGVLGMEEVQQSFSSCLDHRHHLTTFTDFFHPHWTDILIKVVWCVASTDLRKPPDFSYSQTHSNFTSNHKFSSSPKYRLKGRGWWWLHSFLFFWVYYLIPFMFTVWLFQDLMNPFACLRSLMLTLKGCENVSLLSSERAYWSEAD